MGIENSYLTEWNCYLSLRLFVGLLDFVTDVLHAGWLFYSQHALWGGLVVAFPFLGVLVAAISVMLSRRSNFANLSFSKFIIVTFTHTTEMYAAFFESAPELVLQMAIIWKGLLKQDIYNVFSGEEYGSLSWFFGLNAVLSLWFSMMSLLITSVHYNRQTEIPAAKVLSAALSTFFAICLRVFVISILFASVPGPATGIIIVMYLVNLVTYKALSGPEENWNCVIYSYYSIIPPTGYARFLGSAKSSSSNGSIGLSEIERAKVNQDSLFRRVKISYALHIMLSIAVIAVYAALQEVFLLGNNSLVHVLETLKDRRVLYITPSTLLLLTIAFLGWHLQQIKALRDGTHAWYSISMNGDAARTSIIRRQPAFNPSAPAPSDPPPPYEQELLSPRLANLQHYPKVLPTTPSDINSPLSNIRQQPTTPSSTPHYPKVLPTIPPDAHSPLNSSRRPPATPSIAAFSPGTPNTAPNSLLPHEPQPHGTYKLHPEGCVTCDLFLQGTSFSSNTTGKNYIFTSSVSCTDKNCIYLVTCISENCGKQYVGKSLQELRQRHYGHRREIEIKSSPLGKHFAEVCGYLSFQMQIIDQVRPEKGESSEQLKKELQRREGYWQHELMTFVPWGLNTRDELSGAGVCPKNNTPTLQNRLGQRNDINV